jgi:hypothetical protein
VVAAVLALVVLTMSAGLGVVAILSFAAVGVLTATIVAERMIRRRGRIPAPGRVGSGAGREPGRRGGRARD